MVAEPIPPALFVFALHAAPCVDLSLLLRYDYTTLNADGLFSANLYVAAVPGNEATRNEHSNYAECKSLYDTYVRPFLTRHTKSLITNDMCATNY